MLASSSKEKSLQDDSFVCEMQSEFENRLGLNHKYVGFDKVSISDLKSV